MDQPFVIAWTVIGTVIGSLVLIFFGVHAGLWTMVSILMVACMIGIADDL